MNVGIHVTNESKKDEERKKEKQSFTHSLGETAKQTVTQSIKQIVP